MRYRMKTVSELTGIPRNTLVAWERRYGVPEPERLANGYRLYSADDLALLKRLKEAVDAGLAISEAVEIVKRGASAAPPPAAPSAAGAGLAALQAELLPALLSFDRARAERVIGALAHLPFLTVVQHVYFPLLRSVGALWERGEASVAQEHFASAFLRDQVVGMLLRAGAGNPRGQQVVCAALPGERHEIAILALAAHLSMRGCRVTYLGVDVPAADLARLVAEIRPARVCVSAIVSVSAKQIAAYARALRAAAPRTTRIVIGGAGLPHAELPRVRGVSFIADWRDLDI